MDAVVFLGSFDNPICAHYETSNTRFNFTLAFDGIWSASTGVERERVRDRAVIRVRDPVCLEMSWLLQSSC